MSHHHRNTETKIVENKASQHCHIGPSNQKAHSVIDQLKTKVKRKRTSKHDSLELSDSASNQSENINTTKRSSQEHMESMNYRSITRTNSHPSGLATIFSYDGTDSELNGNNQLIIEKDEQDTFAPIAITDDNDVKENVQWRKGFITSDANQKLSLPIIKPIKPIKSLPETNNPPNIKKRRQTVRRTGFQIRDEDFSVIFSDLPSDEQLIIGYPCAWRKDVFMHGRMFLTVHHLCFYTCLFKWEESLCIPYTDIGSVTREKSIRLFPNAIKIRTKNQEQYFFASTLPREKIFITIFRLWQNALLEQPLDYQQLRALVFTDQQQSHDESSGESEESMTPENMGDDIESGLHSQSLPVSSNRSSESLIRPVRLNRRVVSLPPDNEHVTYLSSCNCENHLARTYADRSFTFNVDTLFALLFEDNSFTRNFHNAQKLTDYNYGEWRLNKETGHRERQVTYKTVAQSILGSNSLTCREKQILEVEKSNSIYVLSSEVYNEGMKYTDTFYVATRFCMIQRDSEYSSLRATAEVRYIKSVNSLIKTFIEKNAYSSIEEGINEQVRRLESQQVNLKSNKKSISKQNERDLLVNVQPLKTILNNSIPSSNSIRSNQEKTITGKGVFYDIALFIGIFFLVLHIYLCYKLYSFDQNISTPDAICFNQCLQTCSGYKTI